MFKCQAWNTAPQRDINRFLIFLLTNMACIWEQTKKMAGTPSHHFAAGKIFYFGFIVKKEDLREISHVRRQKCWLWRNRNSLKKIPKIPVRPANHSPKHQVSVKKSLFSFISLYLWNITNSWWCEWLSWRWVSVGLRKSPTRVLAVDALLNIQAWRPRCTHFYQAGTTCTLLQSGSLFVSAKADRPGIIPCCFGCFLLQPRVTLISPCWLE